MEKTIISKKKRALNGLRQLTACAILTALYVVLNQFASIRTLGTSIGFGVVAPMIAGMLFGPLAGGLVYGMGDLIKALLFPVDVFHPGYTITAVIMGILLGFFLHPEPIRVDAYSSKWVTLDLHFSWRKVRFFPNILLPILINGLVLGLFLNTFWIAQMHGSKTYWGWLLFRLPQYALQLPVNILLAGALLPVCNRIRKSFLK